MKKSRFGEEQIIGMLKEGEAGVGAEAFSSLHFGCHLAYGRPMSTSCMNLIKPSKKIFISSYIGEWLPMGQ